MTNLDIILARGDPLTDEGREALAHVLAVIDSDPRRVVRRLKLRVGPFGLLRPSFAIRAHHFRGFVSWLLASALEPGYEPPVSEEAAE